MFGNVGMCLSAVFTLLIAGWVWTAKRGIFVDGGCGFFVSILLILVLLLVGSFLLW